MLPKYLSSRPSASVTAVLKTCWSAGTAAGLRSLPSRRWELAKSAPPADRGPLVHCLGDRAGPGGTPSREDDLTARGEVVELADGDDVFDLVDEVVLGEAEQIDRCLTAVQ